MTVYQTSQLNVTIYEELWKILREAVMAQSKSHSKVFLAGLC